VLRILVVEDCRDTADVLTLLLRLWGHDPRVARDGPQALALAPSFLPDVVLLDLGLPGMDGWEAARGLRAVPGLGRALLLAVSGYGADVDRARSDQAGFAAHLLKPLDPAELRALLASFDVRAGA
jgi:two-component system CheB/CheR fusion protein